ncbi:chemotaxis protein CheR [Sphingomonas sp. Leaf231]|uniref:CheR family methyltransferase n=1 Tax=Sphingomonas sp. Leaf231 TaxID=1736301 RepID=UPI0006F2347A|nr:protein-glutamate O-methyltransferase CheR [Sphingomonas sp. Leaf231]KQN94586.1 chemotaxis protein CheR [Sphingomonas sp. Leaf231]
MSTQVATNDAASDRLDARDFAQLAALIGEVAGIKMPGGKATMLEGRLRRRVRATGTGTIAAYCDWFFAEGHQGEELTHLINAVTTNKTDFFREPRHFDYLRDHVLPAFLNNGRRKIRMWSAACSTGAEPYTMAMVVDAFAAQHGAPDYSILATDLDTEVLEAAQRGIYPAAMVSPVPPAHRQRYVLGAREAGRMDVRIVPALRAAIGFARHNLMDERYDVGEPMDVIFCRNVLIYFDKTQQEKVVRRLAECLRPDGYLFLGHSESIAGFDLPLASVANTVFQRI